MSPKHFLLLSSSALFPVQGATLLSEFQPNPTGSDPATTTVEITGDANTSFDLWLLTMDTDFGPGNTIDRVNNITGSFDGNGIATVDIPDLENPSFTVALVDSFTGSTGDILDSNDDLPGLGITTVLDAVNIPDNTGDQAFSVVGALGTGTDFVYTGDEPQLVFRHGLTGEWFAINDPVGSSAFSASGAIWDLGEFTTDASVPTFGSANPVPEPSTALLSGLALLGFLRRKR
jgi:hypothetical protein